MKRFSFLTESEQQRWLLETPRSPSSQVEKAFSLGATIYFPALLPEWSSKLASLELKGCTSAVVCLEDAISDADLPAAEQAVRVEARKLAQLEEQRLPLFLRVRSLEQLRKLVEDPVLQQVFTGVVYPKWSLEDGEQVLSILSNTNWVTMPILESVALTHPLWRDELLHDMNVQLLNAKEQVLAVRVGGTDLSGAYKIRRPNTRTIYDVAVVRDVLTAVLREFRQPTSPFVVTAPVFEHFLSTSRTFDTFCDEIALDHLNGFVGKTIIHPSQALPVLAYQAISYEEYQDAVQIVEAPGEGGVMKSASGNKMNETNPHRGWAEETLLKSYLFGVLQPHVSNKQFANEVLDLQSRRLLTNEVTPRGGRATLHT
ncbi:HpcH/HpaI aldolase/citrate lyase family protein [Bacillus fonticola]|uniref:HpcH/HpaI aldolase/citrate lyase family protein n=1 Tax=Bacillus fonticola TaxID=2728853 RepID=UPI001475BAFB|nr:HpcH/HpaI aldolase/citrate lyase family protein [Bacillus fonticola]